MSLNFNFSSALCTFRSQIPNPKFPEFRGYSFRNRRTKGCRVMFKHASSYELPLLPFDMNQVNFRNASSFSWVRFSLSGQGLENLFYVIFSLWNHFARFLGKMLGLMILYWLSVFLENIDLDYYFDLQWSLVEPIKKDVLGRFSIDKEFSYDASVVSLFTMFYHLKSDCCKFYLFP